jgi:hypothetical protein
VGLGGQQGLGVGCELINVAVPLLKAVGGIHCKGGAGGSCDSQCEGGAKAAAGAAWRCISSGICAVAVYTILLQGSGCACGILRPSPRLAAAHWFQVAERPMCGSEGSKAREINQHAVNAVSAARPARHTDTHESVDVWLALFILLY